MKKLCTPILAGMLMTALWAQNPGVKRTIVERADIAAPGARL